MLSVDTHPPFRPPLSDWTGCYFFFCFFYFFFFFFFFFCGSYDFGFRSVWEGPFSSAVLLVPEIIRYFRSTLPIYVYNHCLYPPARHPIISQSAPLPSACIIGSCLHAYVSISRAGHTRRIETDGRYDNSTPWWPLPRWVVTGHCIYHVHFVRSHWLTAVLPNLSSRAKCSSLIGLIRPSGISYSDFGTPGRGTGYGFSLEVLEARSGTLRQIADATLFSELKAARKKHMETASVLTKSEHPCEHHFDMCSSITPWAEVTIAITTPCSLPQSSGRLSQ